MAKTKKSKKFFSLSILLLFAIAGTTYLWKPQVIKNLIQEKRTRIKLVKVPNQRRPLAWSSVKMSDVPPRRLPQEQIVIEEVLGVSMPPAIDQTMDELSANLETCMARIELENISTEQIDKIMELADEVLMREPDAYFAHKNKLMLMLIKESKDTDSIDFYEVEKQFEEVASFDLDSDQNLLQESFFLARQNNGEDMKVLADTDLVELYWQRAIGQNDLNFIIEDSQDLIMQFPQVLLGYKYLAFALEKNGQSEAATEFIENLDLAPERLIQLENELNILKRTNFENYWKHLKLF